MPGVASVPALAAEVLKISVTPDLERKWRILGILDGLKSGCGAKFCLFALT
jgi:hypothetical protein